MTGFCIAVSLRMPGRSNSWQFQAGLIVRTQEILGNSLNRSLRDSCRRGAVFRSAKGNCPHSGTQGFNDGKHIYSERFSAPPEVPGSRRIEFPETAICLSGRTRYRGRKRVGAVSVGNSCERIRWNFEGATRLVSDDMLSGNRTPEVRHPGGLPPRAGSQPGGGGSEVNVAFLGGRGYDIKVDLCGWHGRREPEGFFRRGLE